MTVRRQGWRRHFFYTKESVKTTWKLRATILVVVIIAGVLTHGFWVTQIGRSLVCAEDLVPSDAILVENFDPSYPVFERAAALERAGIAPRILVPVESSGEPGVANVFSGGLAELMARRARLRNWEVIPITGIEPISLNAAAQIRDHLVANPIKSLIVVTPGFRSRRSSLVYRAVLGDVGVHVHCVPVFVTQNPDRWTDTWHGVEAVGEQFVKLQYYRFYVLPRFAWKDQKVLRTGAKTPQEG
jgi:uncharacterized SAM-binding protein YcdF (DUF218 family)